MPDDVHGHRAFALWNRTGNRLVALILRSRLHPLLSRQLLLISVTGRRTGRVHTLPVSYSLDGERVTIRVGLPDRKLWWRNLRDGAAVRLRLRGAQVSGRATAIRGDRGAVSVQVRLDRGAGG